MFTLLFILWYFLPAGLANTAPIFAAHISILKKYNYPLDGYRKLNGKRILGDHKTIRGFMAGIIMGIIIATLEMILYHQLSLIRSFVPRSFTELNPLLFGIFSALGALTGDAVKSFFKRQIEIASGKIWFPFDQIDYILGGILLTFWIYPLSIWQYALLFMIWFIIHPISTIVGFFLKLKDSPL